MKIVKVRIVVFVVALAACMSWAFAKSPFNDMPSGEYKLDLTHASVVWKVSHFGLSNYVARFSEFDASIDFNSNSIEKSTVTANINPMSIQTAYPLTDKEDFNNTLATDKSWFNANNFASIDFVSTSITMLDDKNAVMKGNLSFLGVTNPVSLDVVFNGAMTKQPLSGQATMGFSATTSIQRSNWGMTQHLPNVGDEVSIMIEGEFAKTQ